MTNINLHQLLHGYDRGHRLLAHTIRLDNKSENTILGLSDLSGYSFKPGFDEYLTGYALVDVGYFIFSKTWKAQEMPRPGCVWTHSILIPFKEFDNDYLMQSIQKLHRRPELGNFEFYQDMLNVRLLDAPIPVSANLDRVELLISLYQSKGKPLSVASGSSAEYEDFIVSAVDQQWPRLKRHFSFSTGSISPREIDGKLILLQVTPKSLDSVDGTQLDKSSRLSPAWSRLLFNDILNPGDLRKFLGLVGNSLGAVLSYMPRLVEIFRYLTAHDPNTLELLEAIQEIQNLWPTIMDGSEIKTWLFALSYQGHSTKSTIIWQISLSDPLCLCFPEDEFRVYALSHIRKYPSSLQVILYELRNEHNSVLISLIATLLANEQAFFEYLDDEVVVQICLLDANLSLSESLWNNRPSLHLPLLDISKNIQVTENQVDFISKALTANFNVEHIGQFLSNHPHSRLSFLEAFNLCPPSCEFDFISTLDFDGLLVDFLLEHHGYLIDNYFLALYVSLKVGSEAGLSESRLLKLAVLPQDNLCDQIVFSAFIGSPGRIDPLLLARHFSYLHDRLFKHKPDQSLSFFLEAILPDVLPNHQWDYCGRMRVCLLMVADVLKWRTASLSEVCNTQLTRDMVIETYISLRNSKLISKRFKGIVRSFRPR